MADDPAITRSGNRRNILICFGPTKQTLPTMATVPNGQASTTRGRSTYCRTFFLLSPPHSRALSRTRTHCARGYMGEREKEVRNTYVLRQGVKEERSQTAVFSGSSPGLLSLLSPQLSSPLVSPSFPESTLLSPPPTTVAGKLLSPSELLSPSNRY